MSNTFKNQADKRIIKTGDLPEYNSLPYVCLTNPATVMLAGVCSRETQGICIKMCNLSTVSKLRTGPAQDHYRPSTISLAHVSMNKFRHLVSGEYYYRDTSAG